MASINQFKYTDMEEEVLQTVITEVLEELKELKEQQAFTQKLLMDLNSKAENHEPALSIAKTEVCSFKADAIAAVMNNGFDDIKSVIAAQPRGITKQYRILLFPEHGAKEYCKIVLGWLSLLTTIILITTYLFLLGREYVNRDIAIKYKEAEIKNYRNAWNYLYRNSKKNTRVKMDSIWSKSF